MNVPTIIVGSVVVAVFVAIIARGIYNKKKGKSGCSCGCSGCGMADICHGQKKEV